MRSYDWKLLKEVSEDFNGPLFDYEGCIANHRNIMLVSGDDVGLLIYDYPGVYSGHWFFVSRGKYARDTAKIMLKEMFDVFEAKGIRGLTPVEMRAARLMAKLVGFKSIDTIRTPKHGLTDVMFLTRDDFNKDTRS